MNRLSTFVVCAFLAQTLSCSKPQPPAPAPTPVTTPQPVSIPIDLGPSAGPSPTPTPEPLEYVLEDLKGTVLIRESGEAQAEPAQEDETVGEGDEVITKAGSEASLTLDEDTLIHLSENSDVQVDQLKPNLSKGFINRLKLLSGRVLSEVEELGSSHSTFEVESGGVVCGVRGTAFEVRKEGEDVHTFTYHGEVEMRKGSLVQPVVAGHHSAFLAQRDRFQPARPLKPAERRVYQNWLVKKAAVQRKQAQRLEVLHSLSTLPPGQKQRVLENLKGVKPRDRMRMMRQMLKPGGTASQGSGQLKQEKKAENRSNRRMENGGNSRNPMKSRGNHPKPAVHKPGTAPQNLKKGNQNQNRPRLDQPQGKKPVLRPQGQKPKPVLRPNRPGAGKPQNHPKVQPKKPGQQKPAGGKKEGQKKGKKKKDQN